MLPGIYADASQIHLAAFASLRPGTETLALSLNQRCVGGRMISRQRAG
jgi:hypothetical protein